MVLQPCFSMGKDNWRGEDLEGVEGGECNLFVGDCGNYADIPDVQMVGNFHAREWMSFEVPMMFLELIAHYYGTAGIDNDGDGKIDEIHSEIWTGMESLMMMVIVLA